MSCVTLPRLQAQARLSSPLGMLTAAASARGLVGLWFDGQAHHPGELDAPIDEVHPHIARVRDALRRYWQGDAQPPMHVPLDLPGSPFQRAVWQALRDVAPGTTTSYGTMARGLGMAQSARAVGAAVGRNPISIIVPCHRVLGADGSLTGYAGGLERKSALLALEARADTVRGGAQARGA